MFRFMGAFALLATTLIFGFAQVALAQTTPSAKVVSISVSKPLTQDESIMFFGYHGGTRVSVILVAPNTPFLGLDQSSTKLLEMTDDQGQDLTTSIRSQDGSIGDASGMPGMFQDPVEISNSSSKSDEAAVTFNTNDIPSPTATHVHIRASLGVLEGQDIGHFTSRHVLLTPNTIIRIGSIRLTLSSITYRKPTNSQFLKDPGGWEYNFSSPDNLQALHALTFSLLNGQKVSVNLQFGWFETNGIRSFTFNQDFSSKPAWVDIDATYYSRINIVPIVLDQTVGLGLN